MNTELDASDAWTASATPRCGGAQKQSSSDRHVRNHGTHTCKVVHLVIDRGCQMVSGRVRSLRDLNINTAYTWRSEGPAASSLVRRSSQVKKLKPRELPRPFPSR
jgi:hypothetical protein